MAIMKKSQPPKKLKLSEKFDKTADSLGKENIRKMTETGKVTVTRGNSKWKQQSDSLVKSADKDFKGGMEARKKASDLRKQGMKMGGTVKAKNGKSFPDLNKDGKVTKADILKGRGVIAKKGTSIKKANFGDMLGKVAGSGALGLAGMAANKLFGGKKKPAAPMAAPAPAMKKGGKVAKKKAGMHKMPDGSMMKNSAMKNGGKMAKCKYGCK